MAKTSNFVLKRKLPPASAQIKTYRDEVRRDLQKVANAHAASRRAVVANWSKANRPKFSGKAQAGPKQAGIIVTVEGSEKALKLWVWIDKTGTKRHIIGPKPGNKWKKLFFQWGGKGSYQAKTGANPARFGGPGKVLNGQLTVAKKVKHPGFKARKFSETINKDLKPKELEAIKTGGARGLRKAKRGR